MAASYFYLDPDGQTVRGPFGMQDVWLLRDRGTLTPQTLICREGSEDWQTLDAYPELRAVPSVPARPVSPSPGPPPMPTTTARTGVSEARWPVVALFGFVAVGACAAAILFFAAGSKPNTAAVTLPPAQKLPVSPPVTPFPARRAANGTVLAQRILAENPKLRVMVFTDAPAPIPKPDGIELWASAYKPCCIGFILPLAVWDGLDTTQKVDLEAYVASRVSYVREHPADYMIISPTAPDYRKETANVQRIADGAYFIGSTMSYSDDPDGNLYLDKKLLRGPNAPSW